MKKNRSYGLFLILFIILLFSAPTDAKETDTRQDTAEGISNKSPDLSAANEQLANIRGNQIITLKGAQIPGLTGYPIDRFALFSRKNGSWVQVPMQIDQASTSKSIHYIKDSEPEIDGDPELMDDNDEIVFLSRDANEKYVTSKTPPGVSGFLQIKIEDPIESKTRYVYLATYKDKAPEGFTTPAVTFDKKRLRFQGKQYTIELDPENHLLTRNIIYRAMAGERNLIDYVKGETTITMALGLKLKRGLDNVKGELVAVKTGPVRSISHLTVTVNYGPFTIAKVFTEVAYSDLGFVIPIQAAIPTKKNWMLFGASKIIKNIQTNVGLDFNCDPKDKYRIMTALNQPFVVDGRKQADEDANGIRVNIKEPWVLIAKPDDASVFGYLDLNILGNIRENAGKLTKKTQNLLADAENNLEEIEATEFTPQQINMRKIPGIENTHFGEVMKVSDQSLELIYIDDADADDPEGRYPGHLPYVGFEYQLKNMSQTLKAFNKLLDNPEKDLPETINIVNTLYIYLLPDAMTNGKYLYDMFQRPPEITGIQGLSTDSGLNMAP